MGTADANIAETLAFEVDTVAPKQPSVSGVSPLNGSPATTSAAPAFTFAPGAGDAGRIVAWTCRLNGRPETECKPGRTFPLVDGESQLADGQNELVITAIDRAGRKSPASQVFRFRADAVRPQIAFAAPAADHRQTSRTVAFAFSVGEAGAAYGCRLDGAPFRRCDVTGGPGLPSSSTRAADGTVTVTYEGLTDGAHTLEVHAEDQHRNLSGNVRRKVIIDTTAPSVAIAAPAAGSTTGRQATATFAEDTTLKGEGEPAATFECTLDGTRVGDCDGSLNLAGLSTGTHTLSVVAVDDVGNRSAPVTRTWTVDARAATIAFAAATPADGALVLDSPQIVFSASETATFRCSFNGEALRECRSPVREGSLKEGTHTVLIEATDAFGNVSTITRRFTIVPRGTVIPPVQPQVQNPAPVVTPLSAPLNGLATVRVSTALQPATIRQAGLPVTVRVTDAASLVRIRVFRVTTARARAAAAKTTKKLVATFYKTTPDAGTYRFRLKDRRLRKLAAGRYVVEVRAGSSRKKLGRATQRTFTVKRSR